MQHDNIVEFVDRIDGAFPASKLFVRNLVKAFANEKFIQDMTVDEGRLLYDLMVRRCERAPSLGDLKQLYINNIWKRPTRAVCEHCDNTGWTYDYDAEGVRKTRTNGLHDKDGNELQYEYVIRCRCESVK